MAPITTLPGQTAPSAGPTFPLSPFGSGVRVPPPATGSYGNPSASFVPAGASKGYAPSTAPMSYSDDANNAVSAGSTAIRQADWQVGVASADLPPMQDAVISTGQVSSGQQSMTQFPPAPVPTSYRQGGMPVIDLTGAPAPPGYASPMTTPASGPSTMNYGGTAESHSMVVAPYLAPPVVDQLSSIPPENLQAYVQPITPAFYPIDPASNPSAALIGGSVNSRPPTVASTGWTSGNGSVAPVSPVISPSPTVPTPNTGSSASSEPLQWQRVR